MHSRSGRSPFFLILTVLKQSLWCPCEDVQVQQSIFMLDDDVSSTTNGKKAVLKKKKKDDNRDNFNKSSQLHRLISALFSTLFTRSEFISSWCNISVSTWSLSFCSTSHSSCYSEQKVGDRKSCPYMAPPQKDKEDFGKTKTNSNTTRWLRLSVLNSWTACSTPITTRGHHSRYGSQIHWCSTVETEFCTCIWKSSQIYVST